MLQDDIARQIRTLKLVKGDRERAYRQLGWDSARIKQEEHLKDLRNSLAEKKIWLDQQADERIAAVKAGTAQGH